MWLLHCRRIKIFRFFVLALNTKNIRLGKVEPSVWTICTVNLLQNVDRSTETAKSIS